MNPYHKAIRSLQRSVTKSLGEMEIVTTDEKPAPSDAEQEAIYQRFERMNDMANVALGVLELESGQATQELRDEAETVLFAYFRQKIGGKA